jgi:hypothetical protein
VSSEPAESATGLVAAGNLVWACRLGMAMKLARPIAPDEIMLAKLR